MTPESVNTDAVFFEEEASPSEPREAKEYHQSGGWERTRRLYTRWRGPLLWLIALLVVCEIAWLAYLTPGEADILHYECYGLSFWLGSHGTTLLAPSACSFLHLTEPQPAFHLLPLEYPPLTILIFALPLLLPLPAYGLAFALMMTLCAGLVCWLLAHSAARRAAPLFLVYLLLGTVGVFQQRFDLWPAACTLLCLLAAERGRWRLAYLSLALGVLLKFYPIVLLPPLFLAEQRAWLSRSQTTDEAHSVEEESRGNTERARWQMEGTEYYSEARTPRSQRASAANTASAERRSARPESVSEWYSWLLENWRRARGLTWSNCLICLGMIAVIMGSFALLNLQAVLSPLLYLQNRPPQIESLAGSLIWLGGLLGQPAGTSFQFGSLDISSNLAPWISSFISLLAVVGVLALFWQQWRGHLDLAQTFTGLVCVLIVTGKVFSPQYLLWLIPFLALLGARGQLNRLWTYIWLGISLLTSLIYLGYYTRLPDPATAATVVQTLKGFFELVALRNALLLLAVVAFICGWWRKRSRLTEEQ